MKLGILIPLAVLLSILLMAGSGLAQQPGGSNYMWFKTDNSGCPYGTCDFECYGIVANYHLKYNGTSVREIVQGQLQDLLEEGQRSLRIFLFHADDPDSMGPLSDNQYYPN